MLGIDWIPQLCPQCLEKGIQNEMSYNEDDDRDECEVCGWEQEANPDLSPEADVKH